METRKTEPYYKGVSRRTHALVQRSGRIKPTRHARFPRPVIYLSKSLAVARSYAREVDGLVYEIDAHGLRIRGSGHSNQYVTEDSIVTSRIKIVGA